MIVRVLRVQFEMCTTTYLKELHNCCVNDHQRSRDKMNDTVLDWNVCPKDLRHDDSSRVLRVTNHSVWLHINYIDAYMRKRYYFMMMVNFYLYLNVIKIHANCILTFGMFAFALLEKADGDFDVVVKS